MSLTAQRPGVGQGVCVCGGGGVEQEKSRGLVILNQQKRSLGETWGFFYNNYQNWLLLVHQVYCCCYVIPTPSCHGISTCNLLGGGFLDTQYCFWSPIRKCLWRAAVWLCVCIRWWLEVWQRYWTTTQNILHKYRRKAHSKNTVTVQQGLPGS